MLAFLCGVSLPGSRKRPLVLNRNPAQPVDAINPRVNLASAVRLQSVLRRLRRVEYMLREREQSRTDLQMCLVRGTKIHIKLKRTLLQGEADTPAVRQEI